MPTIQFRDVTPGVTQRFNNVEVKVSGWVKCYDKKERKDTDGAGYEYEYENLHNFPPGVVKQIDGEVSYENPHGRI